MMNYSCFNIAAFVWFLLLLIIIVGVHGIISPATNNSTFLPYKKLQNLKMIKAHLRKINKSPLKIIQVS